VPRLRPVELRKLPKTKKRPQRIFGGVLCPSCLTRVLKRAIREQVIQELEKLMETKVKPS
jgi:large subunit ribosomal protein L34e